jgi:CHAD domain-containing protein
MNSDPFFNSESPTEESFGRQWLQQLTAWRRLLAQCGRKPSRKRVHALRVVTLRLQALLEFWLQAHKHDAAAHAAKRWNKQAAKLRDALQPARSVEVCLSKFAELRRHAVNGAVRSVNGFASGPDCVRQIAEFERRFGQQRRVAEKELVEEIASRRARLERRSEEIENEMAGPIAQGETAVAAELQERIAGLAAEFPALSEDCLHEYRKRIKNLRYLAEFFAASDPRAAQQADDLRRMQTVIGEWRDWQLLAKKARRMLKDEGSALPELLEALKTKALRRAVRGCRRLQERLLQAGATAHVQRKKPVQAVAVESERGERQRA